MQSNESKLWLHRLFNTDNFDTWLIISYLYRYTTPGIHYYLAKKLRCKTKDEINEVLPHLVHICDAFNSQPLYDFLCEQSIECYFLVRDKKEMCDEILAKYKKRSKRIQTSTVQNKEHSGCIEIAYDTKNEEKNGTASNVNEEDSSKKSTRSNRKQRKHMRKNAASKGSIEYEASASTKQSEITKNEDKKKTEKIANATKMSYKSFPCPRIANLEKTQINLQGILLHITKMISAVFDQSLSENLQDYEQNFKKCKYKQNKQTHKTTVFSGTLFRSSNYILPSIHFADELVYILKRLKLLPRTIRQKGLEIEIGMLNYNLPADVFIPICKQKRVCNVVSDFSYVLDSAENSPYFVVFEVYDYGNDYDNDCVIESPASIEQETQKLQDDIAEYDNSNDTYNDEQKTQVSVSVYDKIQSASKSTIDTKEGDVNECDFACDIEKLQIASKKETSNDENMQIQQYVKHSYNNIIDMPTLDKTHKMDLKYNKAVIIDLNTNKEYNIGYNALSSIDAPVVKKSSTTDDISLIYKNGAYLLHQLYELQKKTATNNAELSTIKENIINKIEDIKTARTEYKEMSWTEKKKIIREKSMYKNYKGYDIVSCIMKRGNDLRLEVLALQLLKEMQRIYKEANLDIFLRCYKIVLINNKSAYIEAINDVESIHNIKKREKTLKEYFVKAHKEENDYKNAVKCFTRSLVGYSLATYFLQIKDRHNGNILIDKEGHMIHVDYGFVLGNHPGFYNVERAPFKFSTDYLEIMDDTLFKSLFLEGFMALRKNSDRLCRILEILADKNKIKNINLSTLSLFRDRFKMDMGDKEIEKWVSGLIDWSYNSIGTGLYDSYQYFSNGYMK